MQQHLFITYSSDNYSIKYKQRGQVTVIFLVLTPILILLGGLAYDGAQILNARRKASTLALEAARAGAQSLSTRAMYDNKEQIVIDSFLAEANVSKYFGQYTDWSMSVKNDTITITVRLTQPLEILSILGIKSRQVIGSATARAVRGIRTGEDL
ncbi:TadE/TadG family type IV pilus assembly protein [Candidatus Poriferisocius sp.]|uniref:TadE/TadG family type IV pilus assembly protein n=1 Tax=Candidatus Poriferisocius sp. TaxID=3101276 RepID=UPI003B018B45